MDTASSWSCTTNPMPVLRQIPVSPGQKHTCSSADDLEIILYAALGCQVRDGPRVCLLTQGQDVVYEERVLRIAHGLGDDRRQHQNDEKTKNT